MGLILDSSILVSTERQGLSDLETLEHLHTRFGDVEMGFSVVTIAELTHGAYRAQHEARKLRRLRFIERVWTEFAIYPVTLGIARAVGRIEGEQAALGFTLAFEDFAIGVTALQLGYSVATFNRMHFELIPGLTVVWLGWDSRVTSTLSHAIRPYG